MPSPSTFRKGFGIEQGAILTVTATSGGGSPGHQQHGAASSSSLDFDPQQHQKHGKKRVEFEIADVSVGHVVKEQYERYEFPIEIVFQAVGAGSDGAQHSTRKKKRSNSSSSEPDAAVTSALPSPQQLLSAMKKHTSGDKVLYSEYGSPYDCTFGSPQLRKVEENGSVVVITTVGTAVRNRQLPTQSQLASAPSSSSSSSANAITDDQRDELKASGHRVIKSHFSTSKCATCREVIPAGVWIVQAKEGGKGGWSHAACLASAAPGQQGHSDRKSTKLSPLAVATAQPQQLQHRSSKKRGRAKLA